MHVKRQKKEGLDQRFLRDATATPQRHAVEFQSKGRGGEAGDKQFVRPRFPARAGGERQDACRHHRKDVRAASCRSPTCFAPAEWRLPHSKWECARNFIHLLDEGRPYQV